MRAEIELIAGKKIKGLRLKGKSRRQREMEAPGPSHTGYLTSNPHTVSERPMAAIEANANPVPIESARVVRRVPVDTGTYADAINAGINA